MPISVHADLENVTQDDFAREAYDAIGVLIALHNELGRLFDERIYKRTVASRNEDFEIEVPIDVSFERFRKRYWIDMLFRKCCVLEVKTTEALVPRDRAQLINYLLLSGMSHGKLVNLRPNVVDQEFVNALRRLEERRQFRVVDDLWEPLSRSDEAWKDWIVEAIRDWGVGLDLGLYTDAAIHVLGGEESVVRSIDVCIDDQEIGKEKVILCRPDTMLHVTATRRVLVPMESHLQRFLDHTRLKAIYWLNIGGDELVFRTLRRRA